jgi:hypothetical protein
LGNTHEQDPNSLFHADKGEIKCKKKGNEDLWNARISYTATTFDLDIDGGVDGGNSGMQNACIVRFKIRTVQIILFSSSLGLQSL